MKKRAPVSMVRRMLWITLLWALSVTAAFAASTPVSEEEAGLLWHTQIGELKSEGSMTWENPLNPPLLASDGYIYVAAGTEVKKIDRSSGAIVKTASMGGEVSRYSLIPMVEANGYFLVPLLNGRIQALDAKTLEQRWITAGSWTAKDSSTRTISNQTISPISIATVGGKTYGYCATWKSSNTDGAFFGFTVDESNVSNGIKSLSWAFTPSMDDATLEGAEYANRGFYWNGAYAAEDGAYIAFGSENGIVSTEAADNTMENGAFYTVNPETGTIIDQVNTLIGDVKGTPAYDNGYLYFATVAGYVYKVSVDATGNLGTPVKTDHLGGTLSADPLIVGNRLYIGCGDENNKYDVGNHKFYAIDTSSMTVVKSVKVPGYPQTQALLGDEENGVRYLYFTYNAKPGGIYMVADEVEGSGFSGAEVYTPTDNLSQNCISPLIMDENHTLYYKNDSCNLFAVAKNSASLQSLDVDVDQGTITWQPENQFVPSYGDYTLRISSNATKLTFTAKGASNAEITVNGQKMTGGVATVSVKGVNEVKVQVSVGSDQRTYSFVLERYANAATLDDVRVSYSNTFGSEEQKLIGSFTTSMTKVNTKILKKNPSSGFYRVWLKPTDDAADIEAVGSQNVKSISAKDANSKGYIRVNVTPTKMASDCLIKVTVTSRDGDMKKTYQVKINRAIGKSKSLKLTSGKKKMTVKWTKVSGADGYQILYGTNKSITKGKKSIYSKKGTSVKKEIKKLKSKKTYYVKVRAYKTLGGKKYYGSYTSVKKVKVK